MTTDGVGNKLFELFVSPKQILFVEGVISVSLQYLFIRRVMPYVDNGVEMLAIVLSTWILAFTFGCQAGGQFQGNIYQKIAKNIGLAGVFLGIGGSAFFSRFFFKTLEIGGPWYLQLTIYLGLTMLPCVYLLAQTAPLMINLMKGERAANLAGRAWYFSGLGNFVGGLISTFVFIRFLGIGWTVLLSASLLMAQSMACEFKGESKHKSRSMAGALLCISLIFYSNVMYEMTYFIKTNNYASYELLTDRENRNRFLISDGTIQSVVLGDRSSPYINFIEDYIASASTSNGRQEILVLGAGGYTLGRSDQENNYHYVEIDGDLKEIAETHILMHPINGDTIEMDARRFVEKGNSGAYNISVIDLFGSANRVPFNVMTIEFYEQVKRLTSGVVFVNAGLRPDMSDRYSKSVDNTIRHAFGHCANYSVNAALLWNDYTNVVYVCFVKELDEDQIYTDYGGLPDYDKG